MTQKYHISSRILHWVMALLILVALALGIYMTDFIAESATNKYTIYDLHKSIGVMILILIFVRVINRFVHPAPELPEGIAKIERIASHFTHIALYILMILVPISGYLMSNSYGFAVHLFYLSLPNLIAPNPELGRFFAEAHEILAFTLIAAITLHFIGALKHRFFDKPENDVLGRML